MKGVYSLVFIVPKASQIEIGSLGKVRFEKGTYVYVGSALGIGTASLKGRIRRHFSKRKRAFWHIDYLLMQEKVRIVEVIYARTAKNIECKIIKALKSSPGVTTPIGRFGASDCRSGCGSHLCYIKANTEEALQIIIHCYHKAGQDPEKWDLN